MYCNDYRPISAPVAIRGGSRLPTVAPSIASSTSASGVRRPPFRRCHVSNYNSSAQAIASVLTRTSCIFFCLSLNSLFNTYPRDQNIFNPTTTRENASPHLALPPVQGFHLLLQLIRQDRRSLRERLLREQDLVRRVPQLGVYDGGTQGRSGHWERAGQGTDYD